MDPIIFLALYCYSLIFFLCLVLNISLFVCMSIHTPPAFKRFSQIMKLQLISDVLSCLSAFLSMPRVIPCGWGLVYFYYGFFCRYSATACYVAYNGVLTFTSSTFVIGLASFVVRYRIITHGNTSTRETLRILSIVVIPIPTIVGVLFMFSRVENDEDAVNMLNDYFPLYEARNIVVTGNPDIRDVPMAIVMSIISIGIFPLFLIILVVRNRILAFLSNSKNSMSEGTRKVQRRFVTILTIQALIPAVTVLCMVNYNLTFFQIYSSPLLETSGMIVNQLVSVFNPLVVFFHIPKYRSVALAILKCQGLQSLSKTTASVLSRRELSLSQK